MSERFIVAEVSKNWIDGRELTTEAGLLSQRFEHVVNVNAARGYRLVTFALDRMMTGPSELNETIIAVFERVARACDDYRPDHNGECLTCDEPADAHAPPEAAALEAAFDRLDAELAARRSARVDVRAATDAEQRAALLQWARAAVREGAGHECDEWRDARGACEVCGYA